MEQINRRDFLKQMMAASIYLGSGVSVLNAGNTDENERFDDYKAIVYLHLDGGNDGLNTLVPIGEDKFTGFENYYNIRNNVRVLDKDLPLNIINNQLDLTGKNPYTVNSQMDFSISYTKGVYRIDGWELAINGMMPELAYLAKKGYVAAITNVGNLIEPATKEDFESERKPIPPFLFSHFHQSQIAQNGIASKIHTTGWAGRVSDVLQKANQNPYYTMNISVTGYATHLFESNKSPSLIFSSGRPVSYDGFYYNKRKIIENYIKIDKSEKFRKLYNRMRNHSFILNDIFKKDWEEAPEFKGILNAYGKDIFTAPSNDELEAEKSYRYPIGLMSKFKAVAKYASIGKKRGMKRQIFFIVDGGYDSHKNQAPYHSRKLREISTSIGDFYKALESLGMQKEIVTISVSDFGRSTGNNGDGTDHAWGNNLFVVGGAVKSGVYGTLPNLTLGSEDDLTHKGRLIPTTSMSQYYATITKWFGLTDKENDIIFPELSKFPKRDLGFL